MHTVSSIYVWGSAPSTMATSQNRSAGLLLESVLIVSHGTYKVVISTPNVDVFVVCPIACSLSSGLICKQENSIYHFWSQVRYQRAISCYNTPLRDTKATWIAISGCSWLRMHSGKNDKTFKGQDRTPLGHRVRCKGRPQDRKSDGSRRSQIKFQDREVAAQCGLCFFQFCF